MARDVWGSSSAAYAALSFRRRYLGAAAPRPDFVLGYRPLPEIAARSVDSFWRSIVL
jgi:hypothetical protein